MGEKIDGQDLERLTMEVGGHFADFFGGIDRLGSNFERLAQETLKKIANLNYHLDPQVYRN